MLSEMCLRSAFWLIGVWTLTAAVFAAGDSYRSWTLEDAVGVLNRSSWATQATFTRVVGGIGSGVQGEKEIYNTYFVRLLSAAPIRQAYARIRQIRMGYDELREEEREEIDREIDKLVNLDVDRWIVVAITFRSNDPREQARVDRFFEGQTTQTIRNRAYLSTERFPRVQLHAYFPAIDAAVGARFVFPRQIEGIPVANSDDREIVFEFETPGSGSRLRTRFSVADMRVNGRLEL